MNLLRKGHGDKVWKAFKGRTFSTSVFLGLSRDLAKPFTAPPARIPIEVRPIRPDDDMSFLEVGKASGSTEGASARVRQLRKLKAGLPVCYLALADGKPCYMQWLIAARDNDRIRAQFGDLFPRLADNEALLEGAFTVESFRDMGIMASAMAQIAERAKEFGATRAITFIDGKNISSLRACKGAGFDPYLERRELWRLYQRRVRFSPLPAGTLYPFEAPELAYS